jgi:hypothetical protein
MARQALARPFEADDHSEITNAASGRQPARTQP